MLITRLPTLNMALHGGIYGSVATCELELTQSSPTWYKHMACFKWGIHPAVGIGLVRKRDQSRGAITKR